MRLSTILELLLIFLLIAFAAYGRVIERKVYAIDKKYSPINDSTSVSLKQATENINKYCVCNENICNCCRNFHIPLVQLSGPGCASLQYLQEEKLAMQLSIGENILSSNVINGKNPKPVCVALPGGYSKFCGKVYSIKREEDNHFKACLGLELRSASELEASLRVSCFRFGPDGLKLRPAEPLPVTFAEPPAPDDDYDDLFGLDDDDDDEDEEEDDYEKVSPDNNLVPSSPLNEEQDQEQEEDDEDDLLGFGALLDIFTGDDDSTTNKKTKVTSTPFPTSFAIPILSLQSTTAQTVSQPSVSKNPISSLVTTESVASSTPQPLTASTSNFDSKYNISEAILTDDDQSVESADLLEEVTKPTITDKNTYETTVEVEISESNNIPEKNDTSKTDKIKLKKIKIANKKKVNHTSQTVNTISNDAIKPQEIHQNNNDDLENEYEYDTSQDEDANDELEDSDEKLTSNEETEKDESDDNDKQVDSSEVTSLVDGVDYDEDDDSDEDIEDEEQAVIDAFVNEDKNKNNNTNKHKKKKNKITNNKTTDLPEYDSDYGITELLARKHSPLRTDNSKKIHKRIARQSKVMRI